MDRCFVFSVVTAVLCAPSAFAGGYVAPVIETAPVVIAPVQSQNNWTGPYIGANLAWGKGELQQVNNKNRPAISKPDGNIGALRAGYDWQIGQGVFGLGAEYGFGKFEDGLPEAIDGDPERNENGQKFQIKNPAMIFARAGYAFNNNLLAYGLLGYSWAKSVEPVFDGEASLVGNYSGKLDGVTIGAGAEYRFSRRWSGYAEYTYTDFGDFASRTRHEGESVITAKVDLQQIKLGVNYRF